MRRHHGDRDPPRTSLGIQSLPHRARSFCVVQQPGNKPSNEQSPLTEWTAAWNPGDAFERFVSAAFTRTLQGFANGGDLTCHVRWQRLQDRVVEDRNVLGRFSIPAPGFLPCETLTMASVARRSVPIPSLSPLKPFSLLLFSLLPSLFFAL